MPDSVTEIKEYAFSYSNIENVVLYKNIVTIGKGAFSNNNFIINTVIELTSTVTNVSQGAFTSNYGNRIKSVILKKGITGLAQEALTFDYKTNLSIPFVAPNYNIRYAYGKGDTLTFQENGGVNLDFVSYTINSINKIVFEEGIKTINNSRFGGKYIEEVVIPQSMIDMPAQIFKSNPNNNSSPTGWWDASINLATVIEYY